MYYALVDCNSFFVSCERLFAPHLKKLPVVVLSNNDGCVVSRSNEAKKIGIKMSSPFFEVEKVLQQHNGVAFSSNYPLYSDLSNRVMQVLSQESCLMEVYSVDEAFLSFDRIDIDLNEWGRMLKHKVEKAVGIPVSVGVARTKTLAKLANNMAKKSLKAQGVVILDNQKFEKNARERTSIDQVWGIGKSSSQKLSLLGIKTAQDFASYSNKKLIKSLLSINGIRTQQELLGKSVFEFDEHPQLRKQIISSRTFKESLYLTKDIESPVSNFVMTACEKLRAEGQVAHTITLSLRGNPIVEKDNCFYSARTFSFLSPHCDSLAFNQAALKILNVMHKDGISVRRAMISITDTVTANQRQLSFLEESHAEGEILSGLMDKVNQRFGRGALVPLVSNEKSHWKKSLEDRVSNRFTTDWNQILKVR